MFSQRSMPQRDFRFFAISRYLTMINTRAASLFLTVLNHFHLLDEAASPRDGGSGLGRFCGSGGIDLRRIRV